MHRTWVPATFLTLLLVACGSGGDAGPGRAEENAAEEESIFSADDVRPEDAPKGLLHVEMEGAPCSAPGAVIRPGRTSSQLSVEIADKRTICFEGFDSPRLTLTLTKPGGSSEEVEVEGSTLWSFTPAIGDPIGVYTFVLDDAASTEGTIEVLRPSVPVMQGLVTTAAPGETFEVAVGGLTPSVRLFLYKYELKQHNAPGEDWVFRTEVPLPAPDEDGNVVLMLPTEEGDPVGTYGLAAVPECRGGNPCIELELES